MEVECLPQVEDFICNINDPKHKKSIYKRLVVLEEKGLYEFRKCGDAEFFGRGLDEIKIRLGTQYRFFCTIYRGKCWLVHGFVKKTKKTKKCEIEAALHRKKILEENY